MPYQLVKDNLSHHLIECLESLLKSAKDRELTGIAFAATMRQQRYITNVAGLCHRNPTFTRGMVASLDDELSGLISGLDVNETR